MSSERRAGTSRARAGRSPRASSWRTADAPTAKATHTALVWRKATARAAVGAAAARCTRARPSPRPGPVLAGAPSSSSRSSKTAAVAAESV
eukprot:scaffold21106_cov101-Isochrysis_galbana.AAC.2